MSLVIIPKALEPILARVGREWTHDERWQVTVWLHEPPQRDRLLRHVALHLASPSQIVTAVDVEEVWSKFCLRRLDKVTGLYDPAVGPFWPFLRMALGRTCHREGRRLRFQVEQLSLARAGEMPPALGPASAENPEQAAGRQQAAQRLKGCVAALPADYRAVIVQHYFSNRQLRDIAGTLGISETAARVRLHRARRKLKTCLLKTPL